MRIIEFRDRDHHAIFISREDRRSSRDRRSVMPWICGIEYSWIGITGIKLKTRTENWNCLTFSGSKTDLFCLASSLLNTAHFLNQNITENMNRSENSGCLLTHLSAYRSRQYYESKVLHNTKVTRFSTVHHS